ncbi:unnamed protein product [Musa hybrid cultivar]
MASTTVERLARLLAVAGCCCLFVLAQATDDGGGVGMRSEELLGLFEVLGALLNDPSWAQLHPRPCTETPWLGIQCEMVLGDGVQGRQQDPYLHVTKIHIGPDVASPPCKASAKLSESMLKLPYLKSLSLFGCFLVPDTVSLSPSLFANASSSLEQLVIKSNPGLSGAIPQTIGRLQNLRVLSLSQNNLHGEIPKEVGELGKLEQLDLSYNHLTGIIPVGIGGLASLSILDLSWNGLEGEIPWSVGQLQSLRKMDLSFNKISGRIPTDASKLQSLILLDLSHNSVTGPMPDALSDLRELQYFLLEHNPIGTSIPLFLGALKNMVVLGLSGCGLSGPIPTFFGSLTNLTTISLDRNRLNGTIPASLEAIPNLGQLNLSQNQLSGEMAFSEEFVSRLGERLDVRDNQGLCINPLRHRNLSYLEAPPCLCPTINAGERSSWPESPPPESSAVRVRPSWSHGKGSMSLVLVTVRCLMGLCRLCLFSALVVKFVELLCLGKDWVRDIEITNVMDYEAIAKQKLPKMVFDYYNSGAEDQWTLKENREAFSRILFRPRIFIDVSKVNMTTTKISMPIMIAPTAMQKMAHREVMMFLEFGCLTSAKFQECTKICLSLFLRRVCNRESSISSRYQYAFNVIFLGI